MIFIIMSPGQQEVVVRYFNQKLPRTLCVHEMTLMLQFLLINILSRSEPAEIEAERWFSQWNETTISLCFFCFAYTKNVSQCPSITLEWRIERVSINVYNFVLFYFSTLNPHVYWLKIVMWRILHTNKNSIVLNSETLLSRSFVINFPQKY